MTRRPPPRPSVQPSAPGGWRRHAWLALAWLGSVLLAGLIGGTLTWHATPAAQQAREVTALHARIGALEQQLANAQRDRQVTDIATTSLRRTLTQREEEIAGLRADLAFYSRLVGGEAQGEGLKVQQVGLQRLPGSHGWNLTLSLTQNAKRDAEISGSVQVSVQGVRAGKVVQLDWADLGDTAQRDGLAFRFRYFQALHATFVLPADFRPTRLTVHVAPTGDAPVERSVDWAAALAAAPPPLPSA